MNLCIYTPCTTLIIGCLVYGDPEGTTPATTGYYSDGVNCYQVSGGSVIAVSECSGTPVGSCKRLNVTISEADVIASDNSTVTMTYTDCDGNLATYPFNDGGTFTVDLCISDSSGFAFSYLFGGVDTNSGSSGAIITGPCPEPTTAYSYMRDGSQEEGNPVFHVPYVEYIDENGNPASFYADMNNDICGGFYAQSITAVHYCIEC